MNVNWTTQCRKWKNKWDLTFEHPYMDDDSNGIDLYKFVDVLNCNLKTDSCILSDAGTSFHVLPQALKIKPPQKWIVDCSQAGLGAALPSSIGVSFAKNKDEAIVVIGDGSFMNNISALAVIKSYMLPIKIFIWNNNGYLTNINTQNKFCGGRLIGTDSSNGLWFPKYSDIAISYRIEYCYCGNIKELQHNMPLIFDMNEPCIIEIKCKQYPHQEVVPTANSYKDQNGKIIPLGLEQMYPPLSNIELENEMVC